MLQGGFVLLDADSGAVARVFEFQYNPTALRRTFGGPNTAPPSDRPPGDGPRARWAETIRLELELDAADAAASEESAVSEHGIAPRLAALESIAAPETIVSAPLTVFVWGRVRILPVQVVELDILEEAFDASLNPVRATVAMTLSVLREAGLGDQGRRLYEAYAQKMERLASLTPGSLSVLGATDTLG
jgi:hypothetical protein